MTPESKTSEAILQSPTKIKIGSKEYEVAKPTAATLLMISKYISKLPIVDTNLEGNPIYQAISTASQGDYSHEILSLLIIGAKALNKSPFRYFNKIKQRRLSDEIFYNLDHEEIVTHTTKILENIKSAFFLTNIIFLNEINLIRKTKN